VNQPPPGALWPRAQPFSHAGAIANQFLSAPPISTPTRRSSRTDAGTPAELRLHPLAAAGSVLATESAVGSSRATSTAKLGPTSPPPGERRGFLRQHLATSGRGCPVRGLFAALTSVAPCARNGRGRARDAPHGVRSERRRPRCRRVRAPLDHRGRDDGQPERERPAGRPRWRRARANLGDDGRLEDQMRNGVPVPRQVHRERRSPAAARGWRCHWARWAQWTGFTICARQPVTTARTEHEPPTGTPAPARPRRRMGCSARAS